MTLEEWTMSEERQAATRESWWRSPLGRALVAGAVILLAAAGAKYAYDRAHETDVERRETLEEEIEAVSERLSARLEQTDDISAELEEMPRDTGWFPAGYRCGGGEFAAPGEPEPFWREAFGGAIPAKMRFAWRFRRRDGGFVLWARRDTDCDGLFEVYRRTVSDSWGSGLGVRVETENLGE
jgi:hypothetical protein